MLLLFQVVGIDGYEKVLPAQLVQYTNTSPSITFCPRQIPHCSAPTESSKDSAKTACLTVAFKQSRPERCRRNQNKHREGKRHKEKYRHKSRDTRSDSKPDSYSPYRRIKGKSSRKRNHTQIEDQSSLKGRFSQSDNTIRKDSHQEFIQKSVIIQQSKIVPDSESDENRTPKSVAEICDMIDRQECLENIGLLSVQSQVGEDAAIKILDTRSEYQDYDDA